MNAVPRILILDTCTLISSVLRRGLVRLGQAGCFDVAWSTVIGDEWRRNAARVWKISTQDVQREWECLQQACPLADQGDVTAFKQGLEHSDPKDWHVIAAARKAKAGAAQDCTVGIVTRNVRDFHRAELRHLGIALLDPDQLLVRCLEAYPTQTRDMVADMPGYVRQYQERAPSIVDILKRERLFRFAKLWLAQDDAPAQTLSSPSQSSGSSP